MFHREKWIKSGPTKEAQVYFKEAKSNRVWEPKPNVAATTKVCKHHQAVALRAIQNTQNNDSGSSLNERVTIDDLN